MGVASKYLLRNAVFGVPLGALAQLARVSGVREQHVFRELLTNRH